MAEYIDRDAALAQCKRHNDYTGWSIADGIEAIPAVDAVPVVRCKDCKRWQRHSEVNRDYGDCRRYSSTMRYDDFCSQGERRKDNGKAVDEG